MNRKDIDVTLFATLEKLMAFLEAEVLNFQSAYDLPGILSKFREHTINEKQHTQWEIESLLFCYKGKQLYPFTQSYCRETDSFTEYPVMGDFQLSAFDYISSRINTSKSPYFLARYNHLFWKAPNGIKNKTYAAAAIYNYQSLIQQITAFDSKDEKSDHAHLLLNTFEILVALVDETKTGIESTKSLVKQLLSNKYLRFFIKYGIIDDMLNHPKIFKKEDLDGTLEIFEQQLQEIDTRSDDFMMANTYLPTAARIAQKVSSPVQKWHNEIGMAYFRMAQDETDQDRSWIKLSSYQSALEAFIVAGNKTKKEEVEKLYAALKPYIKLDTIEIPFDDDMQKAMRDLRDHTKSVAERVLYNEPTKIYQILTSGVFFPKYEIIKKATSNGKNSFLDFVTTIRFDSNKNISKEKGGRNDNLELMQTYSFYINNFVLPYIYFILIPGVKSNHLNFRNFLTYLKEKTWIGKPFNEPDLGGEEKETDWLSLIAPAVIEFFVQVEASENSKYYKPNYILVIDSLAIKFEGLLRNFCKRVQGPTSVSRSKGMQEMYINNLLESETIKKYFNEDDLLFFNYLFSSEGGLNLRNNVAHSFYSEENYTQSKCLLLITAVLRLAKYNIKEKTE